MVTVEDAFAADAVTASVRATLDGVGPLPNTPWTPAGRPDMLTVTEPVKPFSALKVMLLFPVAPCAMLSDVGEAVSVKVGNAAIVSATVVV